MVQLLEVIIGGVAFVFSEKCMFKVNLFDISFLVDVESFCCLVLGSVGSVGSLITLKYLILG